MLNLADFEQLEVPCSIGYEKRSYCNLFGLLWMMNQIIVGNPSNQCRYFMRSEIEGWPSWIIWLHRGKEEFSGLQGSPSQIEAGRGEDVHPSRYPDVVLVGGQIPW